jgi:hypothetical protein
MRVRAEIGTAGEPRWLTAGVAGIGTASLLSDLGHEVPTALLPSLLTTMLHAPASALGVIEGIADGLAGATRLGGGALADDPARRRSVTVGGDATTAVLSGSTGVAGAVWQVAGRARARHPARRSPSFLAERRTRTTGVGALSGVLR